MTPCGDTITLVSRCTSKSRRTVYSSLHVRHPFHLSLYILTSFLSLPLPLDVLFHEYMECPVAMRTHHPWKRVYHAYLADAAKWNGARGKHRVENLTDTGNFFCSLFIYLFIFVDSLFICCLYLFSSLSSMN